MARKHRWLLDEEGDIDVFALDYEDIDLPHNGPKCTVCQRLACHNCVREVYEEYCPGPDYDMSLLFAFESMPKGKDLDEYRKVPR